MTSMLVSSIAISQGTGQLNGYNLAFEDAANQNDLVRFIALKMLPNFVFPEYEKLIIDILCQGKTQNGIVLRRVCLIGLFKIYKGELGKEISQEEEIKKERVMVLNLLNEEKDGCMKTMGLGLALLSLVI